MYPYNPMTSYSLSQLEHAAICADNLLALAILDKIEDEVNEAIEATIPNDADYSYKVWDAVQAVEFVIDAIWYKQEDKETICYLMHGLHEDTSPYNNHVIISKWKGSDSWKIKACGGQYGEDLREGKYAAKGFKDAQQQAAKMLVQWIKQGFELNV